MAKQAQPSKFLEVANGKATHIKVEIYYSKGGMNYFTGKSEARGIYLSVSPVSRTVYEGGGVSEAYTAFTGVKQHLKDMARFNQKTLDDFKADEAIVQKMIDHVCEKNEIELKK